MVSVRLPISNLDLVRELRKSESWKIVEQKDDGDAICNWPTLNSPQMPPIFNSNPFQKKKKKRKKRNGSWKSEDESSIIEKSPRDLRRITVT